VQPRAFHSEGPIRAKTYTWAELNERSLALQEAARLTDSDDPPLVPSDTACRFCKAKAACIAYAEDNLRKAQVFFSRQALAETPGPDLSEEIQQHTQDAEEKVKLLTPDQMVAVLDQRSMLTKWISAVEEHCLHLLLSGTAPEELSSQYKPVRGQSRRAWNPDMTPDEIAKKLRGLGLKKPEYIDEKLKSAAFMADKVVKPLQLTERRQKGFDALVVKPQGALTLAPVSDKRESAALTPEQMFQNQDQKGAPAADGNNE
jgi:hypothetical protein